MKCSYPTWSNRDIHYGRKYLASKGLDIFQLIDWFYHDIVKLAPNSTWFIIHLEDL